MTTSDDFDPWQEAIKEEKKKDDAQQSSDSQKRHHSPNKGKPPEGDSLSDLFQKIFNKMKDSRQSGPESDGPSNRNHGQRPPHHFNLPPVKLLIMIAVAAVGFWFASGFFWLSERELAVVLRFGRVDRILNPGLQYHLPEPIEKKITVSTEVINTYKNVTTNINNTSYKGSDGVDQTLVLTGDENMVRVQYSLQWKIKDIEAFLFSAANQKETIHVAAESAVREIISQTHAKDVLTKGREEIAQRIQDLLQKILDSYNLGVYIVTFQLQRVDPPAAVLDAFYDMQASRIDADRLLKEAQGYANSVVPKAKGQSAQIEFDAQAQSEKTINEAQAEAARFLQALEGASSNKELYIKRQQIENLRKILSTQKKTIIDGEVARGVLPFLNLQKTTHQPAQLPTETKQENS